MLSIIVTTYKEEKTIKKCLESILSQDLPEDSEILVVCPDKGTIEVVKKNFDDPRIKIVKDKGVGKPAALNMAVRKAKGEILVLTDGDTHWGKGALGQLLKHFEDPKVGAVSGRPVFSTEKNSLFYEWAALSCRALARIWKEESDRGTFWHPTGYLYAIRKELFPRVPTNMLVDDAYIGYSVWKKGYKIIFEPEARVYTKFPENVRDFLRQKVRTRAGFAQLKRIFGKMPRGAGTEILKGFGEGLKIYGFKKLPKLLLICFIYAAAWIMGLIKGRKEHPIRKIWKRVESTK